MRLHGLGGYSFGDLWRLLVFVRTPPSCHESKFLLVNLSVFFQIYVWCLTRRHNTTAHKVKCPKPPSHYGALLSKREHLVVDEKGINTTRKAITCASQAPEIIAGTDKHVKTRAAVLIWLACSGYFKIRKRFTGVAVEWKKLAHGL